MYTIAANQSSRQLQNKVEFSFQSKVQMAVANICLGSAAHVGHNKDANLLAEDLKVRQDYPKMLLK